ncbi:OmpA family protein [uncultured Cytophaga sp.]|uniref:OmpA family protein n=1 Tax=uncultured Cytophaga sp. TaxID=160238 RepID=UPI002621DA7E|nr:OmpA family protein [uncultured Cytophaga sp.]
MIHKHLFILGLFLLSIMASKAESINALSLKNGCVAVQKPSTFFTATIHSPKINEWSVNAMQDEKNHTGWCSGAASRVPYVFVFELSEDFIINTISFNTFCQKEYPGISAKDIKIEYSITTAKTGFLSAGNFALQENAENIFTITGVKVRWIKLTILSNFGNPQWTELMEFKALGEYAVAKPKTVSITGIWDSDFDWVSIKTNPNNELYGCYKWSHGELYIKKVERSTFTFTWKQNDDGQQGWGVVVLNKEGTKLNGIWGLNNDTTIFGCWALSKKQSTPYDCPNDLIASKPPIKKIEEPKIPSLNVMIELVDRTSKKTVPGKIELYTKSNFYPIISEDGMYSADIKSDSVIIIKTALTNYYPTIDTFKLVAQELKANYVSHSIELSKLEAGNNILLNNILFNRTSYVLLPSSTVPLKQLISVLNQYPTMLIELSGHTDNQGNAKQNLKLSQQRVETVKAYLVENGVNGDRIKTVGYGSQYPISSNDGELTRKLNRRVELRIITM